MHRNRLRNRMINFRCTEEEYRIITDKIQKSGKSNTAFLIETLLNKEIIIHSGIEGLLRELQREADEIKRQGINLNQALRYTHADKNALPELNDAIKNNVELYKLNRVLYLKVLEFWKENYR